MLTLYLLNFKKIIYAVLDGYGPLLSAKNYKYKIKRPSRVMKGIIKLKTKRKNEGKRPKTMQTRSSDTSARRSKKNRQ